jgi:hypothetical protein
VNGFLGLLMVLHGLAHMVGFVAAFGLRPDVAHSTTLFFARLDAGEAGSRAIGVVWLALGLTFAVAGVATWSKLAWWPTLAVVVASLSSFLCLLSLPEARIGLPVNALILFATVLGTRWGWMLSG